MTTCEGCHMGESECEIDSIYDAKYKCPCGTCLVKMRCRESCKDWYLYLKEIIFNLYRDRFGDSDALKGHVENKIKRLEILKRCAQYPIRENACAWYK